MVGNHHVTPRSCEMEFIKCRGNDVCIHVYCLGVSIITELKILVESFQVVTRWEAPGGIGSSSGGWPTILLQYSDAVGWVFDL